VVALHQNALTWGLALVAIALAASCRTTPAPSPDFLYPGAEYRDTFDSPPRLWSFFGGDGVSEAESRARAVQWLGANHPMLSDPFTAQPTVRVRLHTQDSPAAVARYYRRVLPGLGWKSVPGTAGPNCEGCRTEHLGEFRQGDDLFKLYIHDGPWDGSTGSVHDSMRWIVFVFLDPALPDRLGLEP
jgi:hypothetical protein